jgi:hypothetical protein
MSKRYSQLASRVRIPAGFFLGAIYLLFAQPTVGKLFSGSLVALAGISLRTVSAGYLEKNRKLVVNGPYAYTRNPLYLGSAVAGFGFCLAGGQWWFFVLLAGVLSAIYWPVLRSEEGHLSHLFPEEFPSYAQSVPLLWPRLRPWSGRSGATARFDWKIFLQNREYEAWMAYSLIVLILWGKLLWNAKGQ